MGRSRRRPHHKPSGKVKENCERKKMQMAIDNHISSQELQQMEKLCQILKDGNSEEELMCALATLSSFVLEEKGVSLLMQCNGLSLVISNILHCDHGVREKALGTLTNLLLTCGDSMVDVFLNNQVVIKLTTIFTEANKTLKGNRALLLESQQEKELNFLCDCLQLLTTLCEMSNNVVESLELESVLQFLLPVIKCEDSPSKLRVGAASCLYVISEENKILSGLMLVYAPNFIDELLCIKNTSLLAMYCNGIIFNLIGLVPEETIDKAITQLIQNIFTCLQVSIDSAIESQESSDNSKSNILEEMQAQQIALELLSNIMCFESGESEQWEDEDDNDTTPDTNHHLVEDNVTSNHFSVIQELDIPKKILEKCFIIPSQSTDEKLCKSLSRIKSRSWQCMSNILSMSFKEAVTTAELSQLWTAALDNVRDEKLSSNVKESCDEDLFDAISSAFRAIANQLFTRGEGLNLSTCEVVKLLANLVRAEKNAESAKMNLISVVGMIGKESCQKEELRHILKMVGDLFTSLLSDTSHSPLIMAEVLDATFDSFADGPFVDQVLKETNLLQAMQRIHTALKTMSKADKQALGSNLGIVNMAKTNLSGFLKYKGVIR